MPEAANVTVSGLDAAFVVNFKLPDGTPVTIGHTVTVQDASDASVPPQVVDCANVAGLVVILVMFSVALPTFVSVTVCVAPTA